MAEMAEMAAPTGAQTRMKLADPLEATYLGRVRKNFDMLDVRTAFTSEAAVADALRLLRAKEAGEPVDAAAAARAVKIQHAVVHPDTGEAVPLPLRVSMIVPMNMAMDGAMLLARSARATVAAQWLNQTYNALHYYANRNASNEDTARQRLAAYVGATASAVAASLGIRRAAARLRSASLARLGPLGAVAAADVLNLAVMRQSEYLRGVDVFDEDGAWVGRSRRCGALAVASCAAGRVFAAAPILVLPPLALQRLEARSPRLAARPWLRASLLLALVGAAIQFSVPLTFGLFRQTAQADCRLLEPEIAAAVRRDGRPVRVVTYNKGV